MRDKIDFSNAEELQKYSGVLRFVRCNKNAKECTKNGDRLLLSPLSSTFQSLLFDEEEAAKSSSSVLPEIGQILPLVGRTAFPCVCEVLDECEHLFTDGSCVVADGVKWQSLFLVFWGKYMILAEPVKGGSSGNGRVVTSCKLSCLLAEKDESPEVESASPARRLFLTQFSLESKAAGLFRIDKADLEPKNSKDEVRITRTGVDLWFEDVTSAGKAYKSLCSKILKARSKRGKRIKEVSIIRMKDISKHISILLCSFNLSFPDVLHRCLFRMIDYVSQHYYPETGIELRVFFDSIGEISYQV